MRMELFKQFWAFAVLVGGPIAAITVWLNQFLAIRKLRLETEKLRKELGEKNRIVTATPEEIARYGFRHEDLDQMRREWSEWKNIRDQQRSIGARSSLIGLVAVVGLSTLLVITYHVGEARTSRELVAATQQIEVLQRSLELQRDLTKLEQELRETVPIDSTNVSRRRWLLEQLSEIERRVRNKGDADPTVLERLKWVKEEYSKNLD